MPTERRLELLEVAQRHKMVVLEDNLYFDLRYKGETVPSLLALDESGLVLQSNGFSKTLACGLRMAWVAGTPEATLPLELVRQDLGVNQWTAHMLSMWVSDGRWDVHLERILASARSKYEVTLLALRKYCEPYVNFFVPDGGIYFWLKFAPEVDPGKFRQRIETEGVGVAPGERFSPGQQAALPGWDINVGDCFFRPVLGGQRCLSRVGSQELEDSLCVNVSSRIQPACGPNAPKGCRSDRPSISPARSAPMTMGPWLATTSGHRPKSRLRTSSGC
jgi:DNA-binding transcriptional MocR family regulator